MGKYRATLNIPGCRRYEVAEFNDDDPQVVRMVLDGHLLPVEVAQVKLDRLEEARQAPAKPTEGSLDAVKAALEAARKRAADTPSTVTTAVSDEPEAPEEEAEDFDLSKPAAWEDMDTITKKSEPRRGRGSSRDKD